MSVSPQARLIWTARVCCPSPLRRTGLRRSDRGGPAASPQARSPSDVVRSGVSILIQARVQSRHCLVYGVGSGVRLGRQAANVVTDWPVGKCRPCNPGAVSAPLWAPSVAAITASAPPRTTPPPDLGSVCRDPQNCVAEEEGSSACL